MMDSEIGKSLDLFVCCVVQAAAAANLYSIDHRQVDYHISLALDQLRKVAAESAPLVLTLIDDQLFADSRPLAEGPVVGRFLRGLKALGIGQVTIASQISDTDLRRLVLVVAGKAGKVESSTDLRFRAVQVAVDTEPIREIATYGDIPKELLAGLVTTYENCRARKKLDLSSITKIVKGFASAFRREANPFLAMVPLRQMDEYTFTHSIDVCILNLAQGMTLGFEGQVLHDLGVAAMLHDVGKMFVPVEILNKPGPLDEREWEVLRQHPVKGAEYLLNTPGLPRLAILSAFEHHLKYDLTGYPKVPANWRLNLCSQMTMVSDCFDALRTRRVYKDAMDFERAAGEMLSVAGKNLNPALTLNFIRMLRRMGKG